MPLECCRLVLWRRCWLVYVESIARVDTLSLSGKILYRIADQMFVQWPQLQHKYPRALCVGTSVLTPVKSPVLRKD